MRPSLREPPSLRERPWARNHDAVMMIAPKLNDRRIIALARNPSSVSSAANGSSPLRRRLSRMVTSHERRGDH
jgi:hypothetical protein